MTTKPMTSNPDVLALGYKNERGEIVVTDVLCSGFPVMSAAEKVDLSRKLSQWSATFRRAKQPLTQDFTPREHPNDGYCPKCGAYYDLTKACVLPTPSVEQLRNTHEQQGVQGFIDAHHNPIVRDLNLQIRELTAALRCNR